MAEKKKGRKRKDEYIPPGSEQFEKPAKEEYAIAKWLRKNVPTKKTKFLNHNVEYFTAYKAVDALMESHWAKPAKENQPPFFTSRGKVIEYLNTMLRHKFYHRAKKIPVSEQELKARKKGDKKKDDSEEKKKEEQKATESDKRPEDGEGKSGTTVHSLWGVSNKNESLAKGPHNLYAHVHPAPNFYWTKLDLLFEGIETIDMSGIRIQTEKKKRKVRLEMHLDQYFEDGMDAYVWIYDPVPVYYWFFGTLLVLGAIGVCLFPLWPPLVRKGVYYLSIAAIGFLVFIIGLAVLRLIIFCIVWILTLGKHHIWLLPNLTQDVGFFASFWPLYHYEYKGDSNADKKDSKKKKKKKDKDSDAEDDDSSTRNVDVVSLDSADETTSQSKTVEERTTESVVETTLPEERRISESESESSQRSSTGRDFEMIDEQELAEST